ncbi:MAG TPA: hypothetical protein VMZ30_03660, partial [Pyrinomonadaceae bacterium]|nr:hypothetical protein [Pyrinomonadaceae bacterium]
VCNDGHSNAASRLPGRSRSFSRSQSTVFLISATRFGRHSPPYQGRLRATHLAGTIFSWKTSECAAHAKQLR